MSKFKVGDRVYYCDDHSDTGVITKSNDSWEGTWFIKWDQDGEELWAFEENIKLIKNRHKHADLIIAWANGAEIEYEDPYEDWVAVKHPLWIPKSNYRIKPKPDYVEKFKIKDFSINVTFDGDTGKPKEVVLINE
jgi:hypothetical protein